MDSIVPTWSIGSTDPEEMNKSSAGLSRLSAYDESGPRVHAPYGAERSTMRIVTVAVVAVVASVLLLLSRPVAADSSTSLTGEWTNGKNTISIRPTKALPDDSQATLVVTDIAGDWVETGTTPMRKALGLHKGTMRGEKDRYEGGASTHTFLIFWTEGAQLHVRSDGYNKNTDKMETFTTIVFKKK